MTTRIGIGQVIESTWSNRRYQVCDILGSGGFGRAFLVAELGPRNRKLGLWCLKVSEDQDSWHRECYFGELLRGHERAVQTEESFVISRREGGVRRADYFLVMEHVDGGSLSQYLQARNWRPWPVARVKREAIALLRLLTAIHGGGMTHRDLTPSNIFVTKSGRLKVGDWGIARSSVGGILAEIDGQNWLFTPERFKGLPRDDTWMVGQLMAMLLSGDTDRPFTRADVRQVGWDDDLAKVILKAIGPPAGRYPTAFEMLSDLSGRSSGQLRLRSLRGKNVCFTGTLVNATRAQARAQVELAGGHFHHKVGPSTDILVRGERSPLFRQGTHGRKIAEAEQFKVRLISESEFWQLLARSRDTA